jgi:23S rRNA (pseudouridine1915-N3)-methyltransferase
MQISLLAVGRIKQNGYAQACIEYQTRINRFSPFQVIELKDQRGERDYSLAREAQDLLQKISPGAYVVCLDDRGTTFSSEEFAHWLDKQRVEGLPITFVLGSGWGLDANIKKRANFTLSLSKMTFPHELARVVFCEQLYRAFTIIQGHPYHHGD